MSIKKLTLSIVIPVYNEERYLRFCLDAIAAQTVQPLEVIVVDNNSTDSTAAIARGYDFVRLLNEPRQGVLFARNRGFKAAAGDIIGRIDADTILPLDWSETVLDNFKALPTAAAITGPVAYYDMPFPKTNYRFNDTMCRVSVKIAPEGAFLYGCNMAMRRSAYKLIAKDLCDKRDMHEDIDLAIHLLLGNQRVVYTNNMQAGASGRRYNNKPSDFKNYVSMFPKAYREHHLKNPGVYPAMALWFAGYGLFHPWRQLWYRLYANYNKKYPLTNQSRKNPMSSLTGPVVATHTKE